LWEGPRTSEVARDHIKRSVSSIRPDQEEKPLTKGELYAVELYGRGLSLDEMAQKLQYVFAPTLRTATGRRKKAKKRLQSLVRTRRFRDAVWEWTIEWVDLQTPKIMLALVRRAASGRLNEAKFLMELTGRYDPGGKTGPVAVNVHIHGIPRPEGGETVDGEAIEVEAEVVDGPGPSTRGRLSA
jgi:hypothetical protein